MSRREERAMFGWFPFAVSAIVLIWAAASFAMAVSGGERSGLHELAPPEPAAPAPPEE